MNQRKRVYVCTPYTHPDAKVVEARRETARIAARAISLTKGYTAISPIVHGSEIARGGVIAEFDHDLWMELDEPWLQVSDLVVYVECDGWEHSRGMKHEIDYARFLGKPVKSFEKFMAEAR